MALGVGRHLSVQRHHEHQEQLARVMFYPHCCTDFVKPDQGPHQTEMSLR